MSEGLHGRILDFLERSKKEHAHIEGEIKELWLYVEKTILEISQLKEEFKGDNLLPLIYLQERLLSQKLGIIELRIKNLNYIKSVEEGCVKLMLEIV